VAESDATPSHSPAGGIVVLPIVFPRTTSVIFIDFIKDRHFQFACKGPRMLWTRFADDWDTACKDLTDKSWDAVFLPGHIPQGKDKHGLVRILTQKAYKPLLVVHHGLDRDFVKEQKAILNKAGIRMAYVPWNYDDPSNHRLIKL
jgi:hypothetical protein